MNHEASKLQYEFLKKKSRGKGHKSLNSSKVPRMDEVRLITVKYTRTFCIIFYPFHSTRFYVPVKKKTAIKLKVIFQVELI